MFKGGRTILPLIDMGCIFISIMLAFLIRFEGDIPIGYLSGQEPVFFLSLVVYLVVFYFFKLYRRRVRYFSIDDAYSVIRAITIGTMLVVLIQFIFAGAIIFPRSVIILTWLLSIFTIGGIRVGYRMLNLRIQNWTRRVYNPNLKRVLIIGAGKAGERILSDIKLHPELGYLPVGFIDDDPRKQGLYIHKVKVLGAIADLNKVLNSVSVDEVIISMPTADGEIIRKVVELCEALHVKPKVLPGLFEIMEGTINIRDVREVEVEDLLRRKPARIDIRSISAYLYNRRILVTGAGGSIGSELCRQIMAFDPSFLMMLDHNESSIFDLELELRLDHQDRESSLIPIIADINDYSRMKRLFQEYRPEIVFHAAAYKHVPLMECNLEEAIKNNLLGTKTMAELSNQFKVKRFVFISTDKAANPINIMGASKRASEVLIQSMDPYSETKFIAVRFGNVLESQGSAVPLFKRQIKRGGPITITHPEMERYFMTISEAVQLVIQAGAMGEGGEIFILDMGKPVKIVDLAVDLIKLSGFEPHKDIRLKFTGIRPGEKLKEELLGDGEETASTSHKKILVVKSSSPLEKIDVLYDKLTKIEKILQDGDIEGIKKAIAEIVPTYNP
ncbi:MAG: nucleoside-diphosphate sugar epimerase/dehydratase, partial [bacterium]|nr:nucleoside-diphosphate sugar epimerase/dehydratase [bacterium]